MKKTVFLFIAFTLVFSLLSLGIPSKAYAQGFGTTWNSSFQVLNLSSSADAGIDIWYYKQDGTLADMATGYLNPDHDTVIKGTSNTYYPVHAAAGFNGSVVISSDQPIAVISNVVANTAQAGLGSYVAFESGAPKLYFPLVMKGNASQTTTFNVQNTMSSGSTAITIKFKPATGSSYATIADVTDTIPAGAAHTYDLSTLTGFTNITKWVGSATVSTDNGTDLIVGVVNTVNVKFTSAYQLATYNGFIGGSPTVVLPLIQENNNGNRTSINCQNIDETKTVDVSVTYTPAPGIGAKTGQSVQGVAPSGTAIFLQDYTGTTKFVGSATVSSSDPTVQLVCVVNQQKPSTGSYSSYEGFNPDTASGKVVLPLVQSRNGNAASGYVYSSINLATSDGASHAVSCAFNPAPGFTTPQSVTGTGASLVFLQNDVYGNGSKYVGGATCTVTDGSGAGLFAIVNQSRQNIPVLPRDVLSSYDGFNQPLAP